MELENRVLVRQARALLCRVDFDDVKALGFLVSRVHFDELLTAIICDNWSYSINNMAILTAQSNQYWLKNRLIIIAMKLRNWKD